LPIRPDYGVLDPAPIFKKHFRYPNCDISLRPFCISTDMPMICNWAWKTHYAADLIASSYQYTSESSFARSYMVMINDSVPLCEIDICHASQDELCDHFATAPGDYVLRLLLPGKRISRPLLSSLIQTCMEYFFSVKGVETIYIEGDIENSRLGQLLLKSGFRFQQKIYQSYRTSNLYFCTRNTLRKKRLL
jgi:hypothetical protein